MKNRGGSRIIRLLFHLSDVCDVGVDALVKMVFSSSATYFDIVFLLMFSGNSDCHQEQNDDC